MVPQEAGREARDNDPYKAPVQGIDVSRYQGDIDRAPVSAAGVRFTGSGPPRR